MLVSQDFVLVLIAIWIPPVIQGLKLHQSPIFDQIDPDSIRGFLQELSSEPHIAGSDRDMALAQWVEERFREFGVNVTQFDRYNVLLSYPDKENPNVIQLLDELDEVKFTSRLVIDPQGRPTHPVVITIFTHACLSVHPHFSNSRETKQLLS